jgi:hypothetical protein
MEVLEVEIIPEDFRNSPRGYYGKHSCVLWQALHRKFPQEEICVGSSYVRIEGQTERCYNIDRTQWGYYTRSEFSAERITELSLRAKTSLEGIPSLTLTLTPF